MSRASEIGITQGGLGQLPAVAPGLVRIRAVDNVALGFVAELDGPVFPDGWGAWNQIERPKKLPITDFAGIDSLVLPIPMLLDRWSEGQSVEPEIKVLETMLGRHGAERPSVVIVEGPGIPFGFDRDPSLRFTLGPPSWGDDVRTVGSAGERGYVPLTIAATQFTSPQLTSENKVRKYFKVKNERPKTLRGIGKKFGKTPGEMKALNKGAKGIPGDSDVAIKAGVRVRYS